MASKESNGETVVILDPREIKEPLRHTYEAILKEVTLDLEEHHGTILGPIDTHLTHNLAFLVMLRESIEKIFLDAGKPIHNVDVYLSISREALRLSRYLRHSERLAKNAKGMTVGDWLRHKEQIRDKRRALKPRVKGNGQVT